MVIQLSSRDDLLTRIEEMLAAQAKLAAALAAAQAERAAAIEEKTEQAASIKYLQSQVECLREALRLAQQKRFGASSERTVPLQDGLFDEAEAVQAAAEAAASTEGQAGATPAEPTIDAIMPKVVKGKDKRVLNMADLPVETVDHKLEPEKCFCPQCSGPLHEIGADVREELKRVPAQYKVVHHRQVKYACRHCAQHGTGVSVVNASMPVPAFPGSPASPSVVAHSMSQKYELSVPLYRQEQYLAVRGLMISRQNLSNWILRGGSLMEPLYESLRLWLAEQEILLAVETVAQVLREEKRKATAQSRMWAYCSGRMGPPLVLFDYQTTRGAEHPINFLRGFEGFLHVDGYGAYEQLSGVTLVGCWAHVRRKFDEAIKALPPEAQHKMSPAHQGLKFCNRLFEIERQLRDVTPENRKAGREQDSQPVLDAFRSWLQGQGSTIAPQSKLGTAVGYCLGQWPKLNGFMNDGLLEIDNNRCERAIRLFAVGRKNWLFCNTPRGARTSAIIYSMVESAKANDLVPEAYLAYLMEQLPNLNKDDPAVLARLYPWAQTVKDVCSKANAKRNGYV